MKNTFLLNGEQFCLSLDFQVFVGEICYPSNTILTVSVSSEGFSATSTMDIDIKSVYAFCDDLKSIYDSLSGTAKIQQAYGNQYVSFSGDGIGHILVSGFLSSNGENGFWQELKFENCIDQTFISEFIKNLTDFSQKYKAKHERQ
jgi:hypothetical protein